MKPKRMTKQILSQCHSTEIIFMTNAI